MSTAITKSNQNGVAPFNFFDPAQFDVMQRICTMFANSELVPDMYRISEKNSKEKAIANCMIAIETANRIGASPLMVMQNMYIVYGKPGWSAKFLIATVNACGRFDPLKYRWKNKGTIKVQNQEVENWECVVYTTEKGSDEVLESIPVDIQMAANEGWYSKNGSKWKTMPKLMLQYRAATYWTSTHAPELSMGIKTAEEIIDIEDVDYEEVVAKDIRENANKTEIRMDDPEPKEEAVSDPKKQHSDQQKSDPPKPEEAKSSQPTMQGPGF